MKGTYRSAQKKRKPQGETNYNDWSDPILDHAKHKKKIKKQLTDIEKRERLDKFKTKTAYCQTGCEIDNMRKKVKDGEPLLPHEEVRQLRLPFYSGIVLNLKDNNYPNTAEYIKELIVLDDMYSRHDPNRDLLRNNKTVLLKLAEGLKLAEDAKMKGDSSKEVQAMMDLAVHFMNSESSFYWLAEELIEQSICLLKNPEKPVHPKVEATLRYLFSSYFLTIAHDLVNAKIQLEMSMSLSVGKTFWWINDADSTKCVTLFLQSCVLLSRIYLEEAHEQKNVDIEEAIQSCRNALQWAKQTNEVQTVTTVLLTLAGFYLDSNKLCRVFDLLQEHIQLCKNSKSYRELCEGYIMLSNYYETIGKYKEVEEVIEGLIIFAEKLRMYDILMKAHFKLAELYGKRRMGEMKRHAEAAFKYSKLVGTEEDIELATCIVGIAQGDPLCRDYKRLVVRSGHVNSNAFKKMIAWKTLRTKFYTKDIEILHQSELEEIQHFKSECERVKIEEMNAEREQKAHRVTLVSIRSRTLNSSVFQRLQVKKSHAGSPESSKGTLYSDSRIRLLTSKSVNFE